MQHLDIVSSKITHIESQNPAHSMHIHCSHQAGIMHFASQYALPRNQSLPFAIDGGGIREES
jgi:hypothetical protein